jgi:hypothetical protein
MKYLSVLVFAILLGATWYITNSEEAVSLETHIGIQSKLAAMITDAVKAKKPKASDVEIESVWTEPMDTASGSPARVKAHFSYHFKEGDDDGGYTESTVKGEGVLQKQPDDGSGLERWSLSDVKTTNDAVVFEQPLMISTGAGDTPLTPDENAPAANESTTTHQ